MKKYNINTAKVEVVPDFMRSYTQEKFESFGLYNVRWLSKPNARYYTYEEVTTFDADAKEYTISYTPIELPLDSVKAKLKADVKATFIKLSEKPSVDTGLGFSVDGGRDNLQDFQGGLALGVLSVRDTDNQMHSVSAEEMEAIILAIQAKGLALYQTKWTKEAQIDDLVDVEACIIYEATPYEYTLTADDIDELSEQSVGDVVTRYKNNCTDWS